MYVGSARVWKPSQTGAIISTTSILDIQNYLLNSKDVTFVLTARFTQDCLENLFCAVRVKQPIPTAVQFRNNLRLITVSQFLKDVSQTSYDEDDREFLSGFLDVIKTTATKYDLPQISNTPVCKINLSNSENNSLYNIVGYIITSIKRTSKTCKKCLNALGSTNYSSALSSVARLSKMKCYKPDALFFVMLLLLIFILFTTHYDHLKQQNVNLKQVFVTIMKDNLGNFDVPSCHKIKDKLIFRLVTFRLKISSKKQIARKVYSSKTMRPYVVFFIIITIFIHSMKLIQYFKHNSISARIGPERRSGS